MSRLHDLVADTVSNRLFRAMRVTKVSDLGPFREISLTSVASWTPGDKIQLRVARDGLTMRTYTPVRWDNTTGDTTILSYLHGAGPGSAWAQNVAADDSVQVVGPRRSIDLRRFSSAPIFVGDETSVGLRMAWTAAHPNLHPVRDIFEVGADSARHARGDRRSSSGARRTGRRCRSRAQRIAAHPHGPLYDHRRDPPSVESSRTRTTHDPCEDILGSPTNGP
jgi:NADPH-dependent ferric siderophore reductase